MLSRARKVNTWARERISSRVPQFSWLDLYRIEAAPCAAAQPASNH
jgi:hypothetical protein